jgi:hypothetical protein
MAENEIDAGITLTGARSFVKVLGEGMGKEYFREILSLSLLPVGGRRRFWQKLWSRGYMKSTGNL